MTKQKKVMVVLGTRPEVIKLAAVVRALEAEPEFTPVLVNTGQHLELVQQMLAIFGLKAHHDLALMTSGQSPASLFARAMDGVSRLIREEKPDWVLVQGDTGTAAAAAMAAFFEKVKVGHVEAGLRTHDLHSPWPEEYNRRVAALSSALHFAPTEGARDNLLAEKIDPKLVSVTGNTGIDSLLWMVEKLKGQDGKEFEQSWSKLDKKLPLVLCTFHRREAFGDSLLGILEAVAEMAEASEAQFVLPLHPNPQVQAAAKQAFARTPKNLFLTSPLDYREFIWLMSRSTILLSDSGGVQEEAPTIGRPVVVTREKTERPEAVHAGASVLAGMEKSGVLRELRGILKDPARLKEMSRPRPVYGDGKGAERIVSALKVWKD